MADEGAEPLVYLHGGYDGIFPVLERKLEGKNIGAQLEVHLEPEDAFGEYDEARVLIEDRKLFPDDIEVGIQFERMTEAGKDGVLYTITDITEGKVVPDGNHPLAGIALQFICTVANVRPATEEEIEHGHVHGSDGNHCG